MVLLFHRFSHTQKHTSSSKMNQKGKYSELLQNFESELLNSLYQISLQKPGSYTFSWILKCVRLLPSVDKSFAKFIVGMDYEMSKWGSFIVEEYVEDNLSFLDELNCISSSVSDMSQACMKMLHGLSLAEGSTSPIVLKNPKEMLPWGSKKRVEDKGGECSEKEVTVYRALLVRRHVKNWVCRIIDSSIRGEGVDLGSRGCDEAYNSSVAHLLSSVCQEMKRNGVVKEISEVNKHAAAAAEESGKKELQERVEELGMLLEGIKGDINRLFAQGLARRNQLLDCIRKQ